MALNSGFAPTLKGKEGIGFSIANRPDRGKGLIYSIQWGFNVGNKYAARGEYVGLTTQSARERFYTHMKAAGKLAYNYTDIDGQRRSSISISDAKTDGDQKSPRLFYTAMRTAMGPSKKNIGPMQAYRFITVIAHVNLFDLAATERAAISARRTFETSFTGKSYTDIINDYGIKSGGPQKLGFNSSPGFGEGSKIKTRRDLKRTDLVAAASYFIDEGRGSGRAPYGLGSLRPEIGIKGADLVGDILNIFRYFGGALPNKPDPIDEAGPNTKNLLIKGVGRTQIEEELKKLGIRYSNLGQVEVSEKEKAVNILINHSAAGNRSPLNVSRDNLKQLVDFLDSPKFKENPNAKLIISLLGTSKKNITKAGRIIKNLIKENKIPLFHDQAVYAIESGIRKMKGNENFKMPSEAFELANKIGIEKFVRDMLDHPFLKAINEDQLKRQQKTSMKKYGLDFKDYETSLE